MAMDQGWYLPCFEQKHLQIASLLGMVRPTAKMTKYSNRPSAEGNLSILVEEDAATFLQFQMASTLAASAGCTRCSIRL
jgi:hypothetical protein